MPLSRSPTLGAFVLLEGVSAGTFFGPRFHLTEEQAQEHSGARVPFPKRMGRPDEYGALVLHIAQNDYLNGDVIRLDGVNRFGLK